MRAFSGFSRRAAIIAAAGCSLAWTALDSSGQVIQGGPSGAPARPSGSKSSVAESRIAPAVQGNKSVASVLAQQFKAQPPATISALLPPEKISPQVRADYDALVKELPPRWVDGRGQELRPLQTEQWIGRNTREQQDVKEAVSEVARRLAAQVRNLEAQIELNFAAAKASAFSPLSKSETVRPGLEESLSRDRRMLDTLRNALERVNRTQRVIEPGLGPRNEPDAELRAAREKQLAGLVAQNMQLRVMLFRPCVPTLVACGANWTYGDLQSPPTDWRVRAAPTRTALESGLLPPEQP